MSALDSTAPAARDPAAPAWPGTSRSTAQAPTDSSAPQPTNRWWLRRGPGTAEIEPDRVQPTGDESEVFHVSLIANPALAHWGKTSGRIEAAPFAAHALFFEYSRLSVDVPGTDTTAEGTELDVGYHLYPLGHGVDGLYLGPRYLYAKGESEEAVGQLHGVGGDIGYQLVIAGCVALNVGIGVAHVSAKAESKPGYVAQAAQALGGSVPTGLALSFTRTKDFWLPLATLGAGVAL